MRLARLVVLGSLAVSLVACSGSASTSPGAGGGASAPAGGGASVPAGGGGASPSAGASAPVNGGGTAAGDLSTLAEASTAKMCALLSTDEAKEIIGKAIATTPDGMSLQGLGTNCIYETEAGMADGTWIKVEIDGVSFKANSALLTLGGGTATQTSVAGFDATAVDVTTTQKTASLLIRLTDPDKPPSMLIQAPTVAMAKAVAAIVLPRLDTLK